MAYLKSEECNIYGEIFSVGGGRVSRISLAETDGYLGAADSIEDMRSAFSNVMTYTKFSVPKDMTERYAAVTAAFGFNGNLAANGTFAAQRFEKNNN